MQTALMTAPLLVRYSERFFVAVWLLLLTAGPADATGLPEVTDPPARIEWFQSPAGKGRTAIIWRSERAGLMDESGQLLTPMRYRHIERMNHAASDPLLFRATLPSNAQGHGLVGVLDAEGRALIEPAWDNVALLTGPPSASIGRHEGEPEALAFEVRKKRRVGFASLNGQITLPPDFDDARQLDAAEAWVLLRQGNAVALCHAASGQCPAPLGTRGIQWPRNDGSTPHLLFFGSPGAWGLLNHRGETVLPAEHDELVIPSVPTLLNTPIIMARKGSERTWWRMSRQAGNWSLEPTGDPLIEQCRSAPAALDVRAARSAYQMWLKGWLRTWQPALMDGELPSLDKGGKQVWPGSRAMSTLLALLRNDPRLIDQLGLHDTTSASRDPLISRVLRALAKAEPVGDGGLYPEVDPFQTSACARVWYVRLPGLASLPRQPDLVGSSLEDDNAQPPEGTLERGRFAFLTFHQSQNGITLVGISKEFLQLAWQLAEGRTK